MGMQLAHAAVFAEDAVAVRIVARLRERLLERRGEPGPVGLDRQVQRGVEVGRVAAVADDAAHAEDLAVPAAGAGAHVAFPGAEPAHLARHVEQLLGPLGTCAQRLLRCDGREREQPVAAGGAACAGGQRAAGAAGGQLGGTTLGQQLLQRLPGGGAQLQRLGQRLARCQRPQQRHTCGVGPAQHAGGVHAGQRRRRVCQPGSGIGRCRRRQGRSVCRR